MLDGWWVEGCIENVTGWAIGDGSAGNGNGNGNGIDERAFDAQPLHNKLEDGDPADVPPRPGSLHRRDAPRDRAQRSFFNTERMVDQYVRKAYFR